MAITSGDVAALKKMDMDDARLDKLLHAVEDELFTLEELVESCQDNEDKEEGDAS